MFIDAFRRRRQVQGADYDRLLLTLWDASQVWQCYLSIKTNCRRMMSGGVHCIGMILTFSFRTLPCVMFHLTGKSKIVAIGPHLQRCDATITTIAAHCSLMMFSSSRHPRRFLFKRVPTLRLLISNACTTAACRQSWTMGSLLNVHHTRVPIVCTACHLSPSVELS